ncbi:hypothetical protein RSOLAG22IIIB_04883 [Rhizoctonia solani]|uniref:BTB domain-containing protein n=1 Tax=Rhizoctonia solani TaxID=456999 RepID=A0A0K6G1A5_9AGAM|nr:hypothetical protein RSOLAG22IIIB_04883 [Rhizoctonia solani]
MDETLARRAIKPHSTFFFNNDSLVAIQVEDTMFNVHKYQLAKSEVFSDIFNTPKPSNQPEQGSSPDHPIIINDMAASDFAALLTFLYAGNQSVPDASLIIPAFRTANKFKFSELRAYLLPLAEKNLNDVDKIVFAREFSIKPWLVPAYTRLCQREHRLTTEEARKLQVDSVLMISRIREQAQHRARARKSPAVVGSVYCQNCAGWQYFAFGDHYCQHCHTHARTHYLRYNGSDGPNEIFSSSASKTIKQHPKFFFDNVLVAIQIEDTMFNVHKYQLAKSEVFSDMFKMPKPKDGQLEEGSSPEHPIIVEGIAASDFAALLTVLYAGQFSSNQPTPDAALIIPAFRLANMFDFSELRAYLLPLAEKNLDDVDKIVFAREFDIKEWLAPAHIRLCQRDDHLNIEEARKLHVDSVLMISRMREQHRSPSNTALGGHPYCKGCTGWQNYTSGGNYTCKCCGVYKYDEFMVYCGPGKMGTKANTTNATLEAEVKQWVEDSYAARAK